MSLVLSLFPGIGLLDMAFELEGFCVVRGPDVLWGGDVRRFHPPPGRFDGVIGGPPCQSFSPLANLVRAKGYEPRFGNLIPEFERCVADAGPGWFLMENVPRAPQPVVPGYGAFSFVFDYCTLDSGDGLGHEQERKRRFTFGVRGDGTAVDLRRWIQQAALMLPGRSGAITQTLVDNSAAAKGRVPAVTSSEGGGHNLRQRVGSVVHTPAPGQRVRTQAVTRAREAVPVALGGSGKVKPGARVPAVVGAHGGGHRPKLVVYRWEEMLRLQGLPPDFLDPKLTPFTVEGRRKAVANGVPLPMGRALARAVRAALGPEQTA